MPIFSEPNTFTRLLNFVIQTTIITLLTLLTLSIVIIVHLKMDNSSFNSHPHWNPNLLGGQHCYDYPVMATQLLYGLEMLLLLTTMTT